MDEDSAGALHEQQLAAMQADALFSLSVNAFMSMAAALVIAYTYWPLSHAPGLLPWLIVDISHAIGWLYLSRLRKQSRGGGLDDASWRTIYVWLMGIGGLVWGSAGMFFIPTGSPDQALVTALVAMGAVLATYPVVIYPPALVAFQIPVFWLSAIGFIASGNSYGWIIAVISALFSLSLIHIGRQMGDKLVNAMRMAIHNAEMVRTQEAQALALAHANEELERLSYLDPLTGLANRRRLMIEMRTVGRSPYAALLIVDVDHFKQYNDTYGHVAGDICLAEIGRVLAHHGQKSDGLAARYGGEEFCLLFNPNQSHRIADIAEALRADIQNLSTEVSALERPVTVSIGWAMRNPAMVDDAFMHAADEAVYRAKRAGRNCVVSASVAIAEPLRAAV